MPTSRIRTVLTAVAVILTLAIAPRAAAAASEVTVDLVWTRDGMRSTSQIVHGRFDMFGVTWDTGSTDHLEFRARVGGGWSEWAELTVDTHGDDARPGTDLYYAGFHDAIQIRSTVALAGATLTLFDTSADTETATNSGVTSSATDDKPPKPLHPDEYSTWAGPRFVHDREEWDTHDCRPSGTQLEYARPRVVVIHHTAGSNAYSRSAVPAIMRGLCSYSVNIRGFDDFLYNFVIDRYGEVWEGRTDSKTSPIVGAHTGGFNSEVQGIALLGSYDSARPPIAQQDAMRRLTEWLTGWYSIDPLGYETIEADDTAARYEEGELVTVLGVIGHRDLVPTSCPGAGIYPYLDAFRRSLRPVDFGVRAKDLMCEGKPATIIGTPGKDVLRGTTGPDVIVGLGEDDIIYGRGGNDIICGGDGDDRLEGGVGADRLRGGPGDDELIGNSGDDVLRGDRGDDILAGGHGDDILRGNAGNDTLAGERDDDQLYGNTGNDTLTGGSGDDRLVGGYGIDVLRGNAGNDTLKGNQNDDQLYGSTGNDTLTGGGGDDRLVGGYGMDVLRGNAGNDTLDGFADDDQLYGSTGNDTLIGGGGNDVLYGGYGTDVLRGNAGDDTLDGFADDDQLYGNTGNDTLTGGSGNDVLHGGYGDDILDGGPGDDIVDGYHGNDSCSGETIRNCEIIW